MNIAYYAPLKAPDHPTPSGDRAVGRMLLSAMRLAGHQVQLATRLRALNRDGDLANQARIEARAARVTARLLARYKCCEPAHRPQLWFTYHLYHKAPDLIGPTVSAELDIPYVVAEASHAPKRSGGAWDAGYRSAARAIKAARMIISLNPADEACLRELLGRTTAMRRLAPFIDTRFARRAMRRPQCSAALHRELGMRVGTPVIACVAMMRRGDKLASYRLLAVALAKIMHLPWQLLVLGDGPAHSQVMQALQPLGDRVFQVGLVAQSILPQWLSGCDLYAWPAVNEAWSMALLEAAAVGLPAVAGNEGGVAAVIDDGVSGILTPARDASALASAIATLLVDESRRRVMGQAARAKVASSHDLVAAARSLNDLLLDVVPA